MLGKLINGRYEILGQIGEGVLSTTYLAKDRQDESQCVVKQLTLLGFGAVEGYARQTLLESLGREAAVLKQLGEHPQIPSLLAHFLENQNYYLVQEYVGGHSLRKEIGPGKQLGEDYVVDLLKNVLEILVFVHQNQVIHQGIRPENLLRRSDNKLVLIGLDAMIELCSATPSEGNAQPVAESKISPMVMGEPGYLSPEQAKGRPQPSSDFYGLGMVGIEALTGISPRLLPEDPQTGKILWQERAQVSDRLADFLDKMVCDRYAQRYSSAGEALQTLLKQGMYSSADSPASAVRPPVLTALPDIKPFLKPSEFETATLVPIRTSGLNKVICEVKRMRQWAESFAEDLGDGVLLEMFSVSGGGFFMGSLNSEKERAKGEGPQHSVTVRSFFMGKFLVTQAQWRAVAALPKVEQDLEPEPAKFQGLDRPVEQVSWNDAVEFCARLSQKTGRFYRLPSEAEWEYACRSGTTAAFHFGETILPELANYSGKTAYGFGAKGVDRQQTTSVGEFSANAFGLYDLHGNVWEWCLDHWHDNYKGAPNNGSAWLSEREELDRVVRGGSWHSAPQNCRSASRDRCRPEAQNQVVGFRVVTVLE